MLDNTRVIIPAAGFGTRMGMSPDQSKEMLPAEGGKPLISWGLDLCESIGATPVVVTRAEKTDLIDYLKQRDVLTQIIVPEGEWPDTILASQEHWGYPNILLLPDTRFKPSTALGSVQQCLRFGYEYAVACHTVNDPEQWGIVHLGGFISEKPRLEWAPPFKAWGILGWCKNLGKDLFTSMKTRGEWFPMPGCATVSLHSFADVTRDPEALRRLRETGSAF